jgi:hypothetical protein
VFALSARFRDGKDLNRHLRCGCSIIPAADEISSAPKPGSLGTDPDIAAAKPKMYKRAGGSPIASRPLAAKVPALLFAAAIVTSLPVLWFFASPSSTRAKRPRTCGMAQRSIFM